MAASSINSTDVSTVESTFYSAGSSLTGTTMRTVTTPSLSFETVSSLNSLRSYEPDGSVADSDEVADDEREWGIDWELDSLDVSKRDPKGGGGGGRGSSSGGGGRGTGLGKGSGSKKPGGNRGGKPKLSGSYIGSGANVLILLSPAENWFAEVVTPLFNNANKTIDHWRVLPKTKAGKKAGKQAFYLARAYHRDYVYVVYKNFKKVKSHGGKKVLSDLKEHLDAITKFWDKAKWNKYKEDDIANVKTDITAIQRYMDDIRATNRTEANDSSYGADGNNSVQESGAASMSAGKAAGVALFATLWAAGVASAACQ